MMLFIQEAAETTKALPNSTGGLTTAGWIFVSIAWTTIMSMLIFCYRKVLQKAAERRQNVQGESSALGKEVHHEEVSK